MITSFQLKFGRIPGTVGETIETTPVTIFVGPNNSGKSRILGEIAHYCHHGDKNQNALLLADLQFTGLDLTQAEQSIERLRRSPHPAIPLNDGHVIVGVNRGEIQIPYDRLKEVIQKPRTNIHNFCSWFMTHKTLLLDGRTRIDLVNQKPGGDLNRSPENNFQVLFQNNAKRDEVRRILHEALGRYFILDPTHLGQLRIRLANQAPSNELEERGLHDDAIRFHAAAQLIDEASDGMKAFTGIIIELIAGDPNVILIDEPEAFLHPPLAAKLGQEVAKLAAATNKRVFASTHSPQFVMGCIQSGAQTSIVRLTFRDGIATARALPASEISVLMRDPLLRSTRLLDALFYEFVVIVEGDTDRAFYQEVNERLLQFKPDSGIPNCLFINAQNKQTVHKLIKPLRNLGIPTVGIVDIDALKEGGSNWKNLLSCAGVPTLIQDSLTRLRSSINKVMEDTGKDMKNEGGLQILRDDHLRSAEDLLAQLREYGIFLVPCGEVESWLKHLGALGKKSEWLIDLFEKMGEDPKSRTYVLPGSDDIWSFLDQVRNWFMKPDRKGIPS